MSTDKHAAVERAELDESLHEISRAVEHALMRLDEREKKEQAAEKAKAASREHLTNRVSVAAIALTMLMSFLGFARSERDSANQALLLDANKAKADTEANWTLYQTRSTERAAYALADDQLSREVAMLTDGDSRLRLAEQHHVEYASRVAALDNENRRVFLEIEDLQRRQTLSLRASDHVAKKIDRYDMGTRVLTLALVLLSVTLLANRELLFWISLAISAVGAAISVSGYFL